MPPFPKEASFLGRYVEVDLDLVRRELERRLPEETYRHSLGVADTAVELARRHGLSEDVAYSAGLIHDLAKPLSGQELLRLAEELGVEVDAGEQRSPLLLHGPVGAALAQRDWGVDNPEILRSIANHTTGVPGMGNMEQLVYLADSMEPGRDYPGVETVREAAGRNLREAMEVSMGSTLCSLVRRRMPIHSRSVDTWNWLVGHDRRQGR